MRLGKRERTARKVKIAQERRARFLGEDHQVGKYARVDYDKISPTFGADRSRWGWDYREHLKARKSAVRTVK